MHTHRTQAIGPFVAAAMVVFAASPALAQEAMYTEAATMPSPGTGILRTQVHYYRTGLNPITGETEESTLEVMNGIQYGLLRGLSLTLEVPVEFTWEDQPSGDTDFDKGVADLDLMLKYRVYMDNPGGVDTTRVALMAGAEIASGDDRDFSSQSVNPYLGGVFTTVVGRHGFNQDLMYQFNTGGTRGRNSGGDSPPDAFHHATAYVYRIFPDAFTSESVGAYYLTAEFVGLYETNGDYELNFSPGIMYEGRTWGAEAMLLLPVLDELDDRAELDIGLGFGLRFSF